MRLRLMVAMAFPQDAHRLAADEVWVVGLWEEWAK
jgi:hypothetical protein